MPRRRRHWLPGSGAHLISRFVDRRFYLVNDADRRMLLDAIGRAHDRWHWRSLSWAAMSSCVQRALDTLGLSDTAAGRRAFDDFVMGLDLDDRAPEEKRTPSLATGPAQVNCSFLMSLGRSVDGLPDHQPIGSRRRHASQTRIVIATVAKTLFRQSYATTARALGMSTGGLFSLLSRNRRRAGLDALTAELARPLGTT